MPTTETAHLGGNGWVSAALRACAHGSARLPDPDRPQFTPGERERWQTWWRSVNRLTGECEPFDAFVRRVLGLLRAEMDSEPGRWLWDGGWTLRERGA